jgi:hypothetical protein
MNETIASIVKDIILGIEMADKVAGLVRPAVLTINGAEKRFPVAFDVTAEQCQKGGYKELTPNSSYKSVMYFEDMGTTWLDRVGDVQLFEGRLKLVGWINTKKFPNMSCPNPYSTEMIKQIVRVIPVGHFNWNDVFQRIQITITNEERKTPAIFGAYTYNELTQYLFYPYDYFALNLTIRYGYNINC